MPDNLVLFANRNMRLVVFVGSMMKRLGAFAAGIAFYIKVMWLDATLIDEICRQIEVLFEQLRYESACETVAFESGRD